MKELTDEEFDEIVKEIIDWKRNNDHKWEYITKHLYYIEELQNIRDEDEEAYQYFAPLLISAAKGIDRMNINTRGISEKHEKWFFLESLFKSYHWNKFKELHKDWDKDRFSTVERQSSEIVNHLSNPRKLDTPSEKAIRKGLVYGDVQSGKTAHIAATIAMYASAGCEMIIVFSGITKALRNQTQDRLRKDLGIDTYGCYDLITANTDLLGKEEQRLEGRLNSKMPCIGVFKKSPAALKRLLDYCKSPNDPSFWKGRSILIIDDESDQYSINVKKMEDEDSKKTFERSTINGLIVKLLNTFERYCYIGFTATPFAPVLNELPGKDSLYPKDFIYPLETNEKYYSAKKIFGSALQDPEKSIQTLDAIRIVEEEEISPKINTFSDIPKSLQTAINYFIIGTACKYCRNIKSHSTMLVHLDMKIDVHEQLSAIITNYRDYVLHNFKSIKENFLTIWDSEKQRNSFNSVKELFGYSDKEKEDYIVPEFNELIIFINEVLSKLEVIVDNSAHPMEERLHYDDSKSNVFIVIGGNTLSRGLTLEGLLVSYFYRTSKLYDTLLQMGRWFGYRIGYEDLARLYTTKEIAFKFSELADIEDELRDQFNNYSFDITPSDLSVRIRTLPSLQITRKLAMQNAISTGINYAGQRPETLYFPRFNNEWLKHNQVCTSRFIESLNQIPINKNNQKLYQNVSRAQIQSYIFDLNIMEDNRSCNKNLLLKFLEKTKKKNYLNTWNVVVMSKKDGKPYQLAKDLTVGLVERSRYDTKDPDDKRIYLKVMQQPNSMLLDTDIYSEVKDTTPLRNKFTKRHEYFKNMNQEEPGLMVIFPINKDSQPVGHSGNRLPLEASEHIIGNLFVFPMNKDIELDNYMTIDLDGVYNVE